MMDQRVFISYSRNTRCVWSIRVFLLVLLVGIGGVAIAQSPRPTTELMKAASAGDLEKLAFLIDSDATIQQKDKEGFSALHFAAEKNHVEACRMLLDEGSILTSRARGRTPMYWAAEYGAADAVEFLLERGADVNAYIGTFSALNIALQKGRADAALVLIQHGADPRRTFLEVGPMDVVMKRRINRVFWPLFESMYPDETTHRDVLLEFLDRTVSHDNLGLFKSILKKTPSLSLSDTREIDFFFKAAEFGSSKMVNYFLEQGRSLDELHEASGWSLLHFFSRENNVQYVKRLLDEGAAVDRLDGRMWTSLHVAAYRGHRETAQILLAAGAAVDAQDDLGYTPLHIAAGEGDGEMAGLLIEAGASITAVGLGSETPLDVALLANHDVMRDVLPAETANEDPNVFEYEDDFLSIRDAVMNGDSTELSGLLRETSIDLNTPDEYGVTLLQYASETGEVGLVELFLDWDVDVNAVDASSGWTALHHAVSGRYMEVTAMLLSAGAEVNIQDNLGWSPLHIASFHGNADTHGALVSAGADETLVNEDGNTASAIHNHRYVLLENKWEEMNRDVE